jgi:hypothetical protein
MQRNGRTIYNFRKNDQHTDVTCDDWVELYCQASTHWDALAHLGSVFDADQDGVAEKDFYNGYRADEHIRGPAATPAPGRRSPARARSGSRRWPSPASRAAG